jgi:hypothetical protein
MTQQYNENGSDLKQAICLRLRDGTKRQNSDQARQCGRAQDRDGGDGDDEKTEDHGSLLT